MVSQALPLGDLIIAIMLGLVIYYVVVFLSGLIAQLVAVLVKAGLVVFFLFAVYALVNNALHV